MSKSAGDEDMECCNEHEKPLLLTIRGRLYDVALFARKHPGGMKVLRRVAGEEADGYMDGETRIMGVKHRHSEAAYQMLEKYALDKCFKSEDNLLNGDAMLLRVGDLHDKYWTWIHQPYEGSLRLFGSDVLEMMTRTSWWIVPLIWLPLVLFFTIRAFGLLFNLYGFSQGLVVWAIYFSLGVLAWTLLEYILHRFAFHWQPNPKSSNQILFHFLLHGLHHKTPMDGDRLVFPPVPALPIVLFFYVLYINILPYHVFCCFAAGKLFGYVVYDVTHYYLHHGNPRPLTNLHFRKVYHHNHHFKDFDLAFGISTVIWDHVFHTVGMGPL
ncbi:unnamed protein product [Anisakis simplex]|uniref:Fatty acid 2-hydroxylase n=1 Tax=Anisakis simplex TaxID=6269 RepID=A0A0M3IYB1_ANISI|nr:unnamed protein product [Anisakis simplex]